MKRTWAIIGWLSCLGCGDASEEPRTERDRTLAELDQVSAEAVCEEVDRQMRADREYVQLFCVNGGLVSQNFTRVPCVTGRDRCLSEVPSTCDPQILSSELWKSMCPKVTVGMWLDCLAGARARSKELYAGFTCETPWSEAGGALFGFADILRTEDLPGCRGLKRACPAFAGTE